MAKSQRRDAKIINGPLDEKLLDGHVKIQMRSAPLLDRPAYSEYGESGYGNGTQC